MPVVEGGAQGSTESGGSGGRLREKFPGRFRGPFQLVLVKRSGIVYGMVPTLAYATS